MFHAQEDPEAHQEGHAHAQEGRGREGWEEMLKRIDPKHFATVCGALAAEPGAKSAVKYLDEKTVVKATYHNKPKANHAQAHMVVTFGRPNYLERIFIKRCKQAGEPFPVKKVQFRFYPKKKGAK